MSVLELVFSRRRWCCQFDALRPDQHQSASSAFHIVDSTNPNSQRSLQAHGHLSKQASDCILEVQVCVDGALHQDATFMRCGLLLKA